MVNKNRIHIYLEETELNNLDELNKTMGISKSKIVGMLVKTLYENKNKLVGIKTLLSQALNND